MSNILSKIKRGDSDLPPRTLLAGPEGVGKSTFAAKSKNPFFICSEDGLTGLEHIERLSPPNLVEFNEILDALLVECKNPNSGKDINTIVIDTTDWLERLIAKSCCDRDGKANIEDYGYGKGYVVAETELVSILQKLDAIRQKHKVGIILLSHVHIRTFNDPRGESWERYEMKGHKRFTGILREWPDACLFAVFEVVKTKTKGENREKTIDGGRIMHTQWSPAWDAKNRMNLPDEILFDENAYENFTQAIKDNSVSALRATVKGLQSAIPAEEKEKWKKFFGNLENQTADALKKAIAKIESYPKAEAK